MKPITLFMLFAFLFMVGVQVVAVPQPAQAAWHVSGTVPTDANLVPMMKFGVDGSKTVTKTVTGTKPTFVNMSVSTMSMIQWNCVNPTTGAAAAARLKPDGATTEIPLNGATVAPFAFPSTTTFFGFTKYSTANSTDSIRCTGYGF